jgi:hypothetical protein
MPPVVMVMASAVDGIRQILDAGELSAAGRALEIRGELTQLSCLSGIALGACLLCGSREIRSDLRRYLRVLRRIRLLQILELVQHLRKRRELIAVLGGCRAGRAARFSAARRSGVLKSGRNNLLHRITGGVQKRADVHTRVTAIRLPS